MTKSISTPSALPSVAVVIVSWNAREYVIKCLDALAASTGVALDICVVDNASDDGTPESVSARFSDVTLIRNDRNAGFAAANNIGLTRAHAAYIALINSDVEVEPSTLADMVCYLESNPDVGLLGPTMLVPGGGVGRSTMRFPSATRTLRAALAVDRALARVGIGGGSMMSEFHHDRTKDVDVLNGWFWMARPAALRQVGSLDERFFMYGEDIDWCRRFHQHGWKVRFFSGAQALHYGGASSGVAPVRFHVEMQKANVDYYAKHHGPARTQVYIALLLLHHCVRVIAYSTIGPILSAKRSTREKRERSIASVTWLWQRYQGRVATAADGPGCGRN